MYQYTTPTISITIPDSLDVSDMTSLVVTLLQGKKKLEKQLTDVQLDTVNNASTFVLTQEETGMFDPSNLVAIQCHILVNDTAYATNIMSAQIGLNIHGKVIV